MDNDRSPLPLWPAWVLAGASAGAATGFVGFGAYALAPDSGPAPILALLLLGPLLAVPQWLVLRGRIAGAGWWVLATALSYPVGFLAALALGLSVGFLVFAVMGLAWSALGQPVLFGAEGAPLLAAWVSGTIAGAVVAGATVGTAQFLVLRRSAPAAPFWILVSVLGACIFAPTILCLLDLLVAGTSAGGAYWHVGGWVIHIPAGPLFQALLYPAALSATLSVTGAVYGVTTGIGLSRLIGRVRSPR
jgi:hypothetical protein